MCAISDARSKPSTPRGDREHLDQRLGVVAVGGEHLVDLRERVRADRVAARELAAGCGSARRASTGGTGRRATSVAPAASASATAVGGIAGTTARIGTSASAGTSRASATRCAASAPVTTISAGHALAAIESWSSPTAASPLAGELGDQLRPLVLAAAEHDDGCALHGTATVARDRDGRRDDERGPAGGQAPSGVPPWRRTKSSISCARDAEAGGIRGSASGANQPASAISPSDPRRSRRRPSAR